LRGGHSGLEIDKGRGNAIKIANRVILELLPLGARLSKIEGGNKHNAIPREVEALLSIPKGKWNKTLTVVDACNVTIRAEYATVEPGLSIAILEKAGAKRGTVFSKPLQAVLTRTIAALPHGVIKMSADIPGLVETSTNVAVIRTESKGITLATSQRSSVASEILEICQSVASVLELGGAKVKTTDGYPGWKPNMKSEILRVARSTYRELYGREPDVKAIHAGLECGIIGERFPGMDMVSFGPTLEGVHSPDEKIHIDTVEKYWNFLLAILRNVK
jgi:dipeptidase D